MSVLSDTIENFIKSLMGEYEGRIELQRNELAQHFNCLPGSIDHRLRIQTKPENDQDHNRHDGQLPMVQVRELPVFSVWT